MLNDESSHGYCHFHTFFILTKNKKLPNNLRCNCGRLFQYIISNFNLQQEIQNFVQKLLIKKSAFSSAYYLLNYF